MPQTRTAPPASAAVPGTFLRRTARFAPAAVTLAVPGAEPEHQVIWVYAIAARPDPDHLERLTGVGGEEVRTVAQAGLHAVVGSVDAATFGEDRLPSVLADLSNIELIGRVHHEVIESVAADSPVVPLRLATIYPDDATVAALLTDHHDRLTGLLQSFTGMQEWGVRVYLEPRSEADADDLCVSTSGGQASSRDQQPRWQKAESCAGEIDRVLSDLAISARRHPAPDLRFGAADGWLVLNGVYLISESRAEEFAELAQRLAREHAGLRAEVTGPWPPYSFADNCDA